MENASLKSHKQSVTKIEKHYFKREFGSTYIVNEDLEHVFTKDEVKLFDMLWKEGRSLKNIATYFKRNPDEMFLLLFDRVRKKPKMKVDWEQIWRDVG
ncbi:hypothetical protein [Alteribacillus sp. YIM 98480]|uniref:hypothetical protein n=1 Tax=Alteribacillus sp. YIM 98480 TaxID=2606599 RepID=UPI00131D7AA9|nr:hypothetical protein [Alteribacillus sp. YIM 98480]